MARGGEKVKHDEEEDQAEEECAKLNVDDIHPLFQKTRKLCRKMCASCPHLYV